MRGGKRNNLINAQQGGHCCLPVAIVRLAGCAQLPECPPDGIQSIYASPVGAEDSAAVVRSNSYCRRAP